MQFLQTVLNVTMPTLGVGLLVTLLPWVLLARTVAWLHSLIFSDNMRNKSVIITGASSGIGEYMAFEYARRGANLVLAARREDRMREVAETCRSLGSPSVRTVHADVSKESDCKRIIEETIHHLGRIDHLVNNAAIASSFLFEEASSPAALAPIMDVTFWGYVYTTFYALPHLRRSRGRIVVNASTAGLLPMPRMSIYNAAKSAVINFFDSLRTEVGPAVGITVATPGWIESELTLGKLLMKDGSLEVNETVRDVQLGPAPVVYTEDCAKAIVRAACRRSRSVCIPKWYSVVFLYRLLLPEVLDRLLYLFYVYRPQAAGKKEHPPLSKAILDLTGAKRILYPASIRNPHSASAKSE